MPSTTTNYGWTYPISSDDLNAGATSIGSLASGADASLKSVFDTALSRVMEETPAVLNREVKFGYSFPTTNSLGGVLLNDAKWTSAVFGNCQASGWLGISAAYVTSTGYLTFGGWNISTSTYGPVGSTTIRVNWVRWQ